MRPHHAGLLAALVLWPVAGPILFVVLNVQLRSYAAIYDFVMYALVFAPAVVQALLVRWYARTARRVWWPFAASAVALLVAALFLVAPERPDSWDGLDHAIYAGCVVVVAIILAVLGLLLTLIIRPSAGASAAPPS